MRAKTPSHRRVTSTRGLSPIDGPVANPTIGTAPPPAKRPGGGVRRAPPPRPQAPGGERPGQHPRHGIALGRSDRQPPRGLDLDLHRDESDAARRMRRHPAISGGMVLSAVELGRDDRHVVRVAGEGGHVRLVETPGARRPGVGQRDHVVDVDVDAAGHAGASDTADGLDGPVRVRTAGQRVVSVEGVAHKPATGALQQPLVRGAPIGMTRAHQRGHAVGTMVGAPGVHPESVQQIAGTTDTGRRNAIGTQTTPVGAQRHAGRAGQRIDRLDLPDLPDLLGGPRPVGPGPGRLDAQAHPGPDLNLATGTHPDAGAHIKPFVGLQRRRRERLPTAQHGGHQTAVRQIGRLAGPGAM